MSIVKVLLVTSILMVLAFSGMFIKILLTRKDGRNKDDSFADQTIGCGCSTSACCKTAS